jgi:VCBS repeat-containing protein
MQGNVYIEKSSGQMEEKTVTAGDGILLNPGEKILIAAEADTAEIHYESDTRAVIHLEGIGDFSVESEADLPEKIAMAPQLIRAGQPDAASITFEDAAQPPIGAELSILKDTPLMHQAGADSTSYADSPSTPQVEFVLPETLQFDFTYLASMHNDGKARAASGANKFNDSLPDTVFAYNPDPEASLPLLTLDANAAGNEDTVISLYIRAGLTDTDGSETLAVIISGLPEGSVLSAGTDNGDGTWTLTTDDLPGLTITPPPNWDEEFDITVTATSTESSTGDTSSVTDTIHVDITPINDPPVAGAVDLGQMNEDTSLTVTAEQLLAGSSDVEGDALNISSVATDPAVGTITDNGNGVWTFTPAADLTGDDFLISFTVTDGNGGTATGMATVDITPVNDPPVAGAVDLGSVDEDTSLTFTAEQLLANSHDVDGDPLTVTGVSVNPHYGTVVENLDGTWTFTPAENFHGDDVALTFNVEDPSGTWSSNVATVDVLSVNDAPVVGDVDLGDTHLETAVTFSGRQLLSNSHDVDGDTLTVTAVSVDPALGAIAYDAATDTWTFTPAAGVTGEDVEIAFTVSDGQASASARAFIDVTDDPSGNRPPVADDVDLGQMNEDSSIRITAAQLLANTHDPDGDPRAIASLTVNPYYGTVTDNGDNTWTFTPIDNFHGDDVALTFTVSDGKGGEATAVATVDVIEQPDLPVAGDVDLGQINEDTSITFTAAQLLANSYDPDGDPMSIASVTVNPHYGIVTDNGDGTWTFTPAENFHGNDVPLTFMVQDNDGTVSATALVDVLGQNDAPVAGNVDLGQCQAGTERVIFAHELLAFSHDPDGDPLSVTHVSVDPSHGVITANPDGTWTFIPNDGFTGDDVAIRFTVSDGELTAGAEAFVDVVDDPGGNQPPVTGPVYLGSTPEDTSLIIPAADLLLSTTDPDGDPLTVTSVAVDPAYGLVEDNGDGTWTFTPTENFNGTNIPLVYTVSDGRGGVSTGVGRPGRQRRARGRQREPRPDFGRPRSDHHQGATSGQFLRRGRRHPEHFLRDCGPGRRDDLGQRERRLDLHPG